MLDIRIGTSAFTAAGWETVFYPPGLKDADRLTFYATKFNTVEVDSTFYRTPALTTVKGWYAKTPAEFVLALKVPKVVTHEKILVDCDAEFREFLTAASELKEKLGPILIQFEYQNKAAFKYQSDFLARLKPFLAKLPKDFRFACEIRNRDWIDATYADLLRENSVAMTLIDHAWVPRPWEFETKFDFVTTDFSYIRLLGDRKRIEKLTKTWDKVIVDRREDLAEWIKVVRRVHERKIQIFIFGNNHYQGYAPATAEALERLLGSNESSRAPRRNQGGLFE